MEKNSVQSPQSIKEKYHVASIPKEHSYEWLLKKHYARRLPSAIVYTFGLFDESKTLQGVCVFGMGARMFNNGYGIFDGKYQVKTYELVRLCVNEGLEKNVLSFFLGQVFELLQKPMCLFSFADSNMNHSGYIYQATNWLYTGMSKPRTTFYDTLKKEFVHERSMVQQYGSSARASVPPHIEIGVEEGGKHRYFYFLGNKREKEEMRKLLSYEVLPYPKGVNIRYDASYRVMTQARLL